MKLAATAIRIGLLLTGSLLLSGCLQSATSQLDEEREPHFLAGKRRVIEMDYKGAIEAFERASEVNPRSARAHLELGWLLENEKGESDPVAAIYHYEQYLRLRPGADNAEIIKQHILACKQELARTVSLAPVSEKQQREFEQLVEENQKLREEAEKWRAYNSGRVTNSVGPLAAPARATTTAAAQQDSSRNPAPRSGTTARANASSGRSHTVQAGETPIRIARKYGVKLQVLMAANPGVDARRLQPGQALTVPVP